jgi:hypothetical protein
MRFALALIVTLLAAFPALASPGCMTHSEAKHAYGRDTYLHWHGNHCWGVRHVASRRSKESAPVVETPQHAEQLPNRETALAGADTVWPAPPTDFTWADRWPNQDRISPDRWLLELVQFGSNGNR